MTDQFCTYFDHRYVPKGLAMWRSLKKHRPTAVLHVLCLTEACQEILAGLHLTDVQLHPLASLEAADSGLARVRGNRSLLEYYFTITPCFPRHLLRTRPDIERLTYVDADLFFFADPQPVFDEIGTDAIGVIEHRFPEFLSDRRQYGRFNVGWLTFRNDPIAHRCLDEWREQCLDWCYDHADGGRFAEQKYLDTWPWRFQLLTIVQHPGANLAPWNLGRFAVAGDRRDATVDGRPLLFYHAHGFEPSGPARARRLNLIEYGVEETAELDTLIFRPYERALLKATAEVALPLALALTGDRARHSAFLVDTLKARVSFLDGQAAAREADSAARAAERADREKHFEADLASRAEAITQLQACVSTLQANLAARNADNAALQVRVATVEADSAAREAERADGEKIALADLTARAETIALLQAEVSSLQTNLAARNEANATLQARVAAVEADSTARNATLGMLEASLVSSETARNTLAGTLKSAQDQLQQVEAVRLAQVSTIALFQAQRDEALAALESESTRRRRAEEHLALIFRSGSWRATALLRLIRDRIMGGPRTS